VLLIELKGWIDGVLAVPPAEQALAIATLAHALTAQTQQLLHLGRAKGATTVLEKLSQGLLTAKPQQSDTTGPVGFVAPGLNHQLRQEAQIIEGQRGGAVAGLLQGATRTGQLLQHQLTHPLQQEDGFRVVGQPLLRLLQCRQAGKSSDGTGGFLNSGFPNSHGKLAWVGFVDA
jgi:hypothetical protein